jgi:hypothetical protein
VACVALPAESQEHAVSTVDRLSGAHFFSIMSQLLYDNPPLRLDSAIHEELKILGFGLHSRLEGLPPQARSVAERAARLAKRRIESYKPPCREIGSWSYDASCESCAAADYVRRSAIARERLRADVPQDYVRLIAARDSAGRELDGQFDYSLLLAPHARPPARGPWFIGTRPPAHTAGGTLRPSPDGTIAIRFGRWRPAEVPESNFVRVAEGAFCVVVHAFWPSQELLDGAWIPPAVERIREAAST